MAKENEQDARIEELKNELRLLSARVEQLELQLTASGRRLTAAGVQAATQTVQQAVHATVTAPLAGREALQEAEPAAALQAAQAAGPEAAQPSREASGAAAQHSWLDSAAEAPEEISEELLQWAGKAHLLTRLSTLCFLLVVALGLRTITDNNLINTLAGSMLGMAYAALLMVTGAWRYHRQSPLAPIFAATGAVLMSTIVVETHTRFASLPLVPAYLTLIATGCGMAWVSYRYHRFLPISLGTLGMCLAGAAIDYPHPFFPYLALVLFTANVLGYFAAKLKSCSWLRWIVLIVTMAMLQLWAVRLGMTLLGKETMPAELAPPWFLPALGSFFALYFVLALIGVLLTGDQKVSRFNFTLPSLNALWAFSAGAYVTHCMGGSKPLFGIFGMALAAAHFGVAFWLAGRREGAAPGSNSFACGGMAMAAVAVPLAFGYAFSLPVLSVVAFFMVILSRKWQNGGIRFTSYLVQLYAAVGLAVYLHLNPPAAADMINMLPAALLAVVSLYQYQWCREWPPPPESVLGIIDAVDRSAVMLLISSLVSAFLTLRIAVLQGLTLSLRPAEVANAYGCSQSILINASAGLIMILAYSRRNKEVRNVAILITLIGALKVFLYDLLGTHGVPLVASVFTFGLAAAVESVALGRWQKNPEPPPKAEKRKGPIMYGTPLAPVVPEKPAAKAADDAASDGGEPPPAPAEPTQ